MILPKHPNLMTEEELAQVVRSWIDMRLPESSELDYKEEISIESVAAKVELAKDVSSFANEGGGVLLYGVPEEDKGQGPVPKDLSECGMDIPGDLPPRIENVLLGVVKPPLYGLVIKSIDIPELTPRKLLMIYHPESWAKPHMVEGYKKGRYYRRGNFQAIIMDERHIEAAYMARRVAWTHAEDFFRTGNFGPVYNVRQLRVIACPRFPLLYKEEMLERQFKAWLDGNLPRGSGGKRTGTWITFVDGWRFLGVPSGVISGKEYELRVFHNGGVCLNQELNVSFHKEDCLNLDEVAPVIRWKMLESTARFLQELSINGPLLVQVSIFNTRGTCAYQPVNDHEKVELPLVDSDSIVFIEETSVEEISASADVVLERLLNRLYAAYGIWNP